MLVGIVVIIGGIVGIVAPGATLALGRSLLTPTALYFVAAIRVVFGLVLLAAAGKSRAPAALRVLGAFILVAGIATPFFGVERSRAAVDWWSGHGALFMRTTMGLAVVLGAFLVWTVASERRSTESGLR
jgi:uncharacterized membrane protein